MVLLRKRIKCFPSTLRRRNLKTQQSFWGKLGQSKIIWGKVGKGNHTRKLNFQNVFSRRFQISPVWKVFSKLHFRDGLVRTVGLTREIKLRFQLSPAYCGRRNLSVTKFDCLDFLWKKGGGNHQEIKIWLSSILEQTSTQRWIQRKTSNRVRNRTVRYRRVNFIILIIVGYFMEFVTPACRLNSTS